MPIGVWEDVMKTFLNKAFLGLLLASSVASGFALAEDSEESKSPTVWDRLLFRNTKTKVIDAEPTDKSKAAENDEAILLYQQASRRAREEVDYFRRLEACDRLMEIAIQRNDVAMQRQIDELQGRIQEVYNKRTEFLSTHSTNKSTDEARLAKSLASENKNGWGFTGKFGREKPKALDANATALSKKKSKTEDDE